MNNIELCKSIRKIVDTNTFYQRLGITEDIAVLAVVKSLGGTRNKPEIFLQIMVELNELDDHVGRFGVETVIFSDSTFPDKFLEGDFLTKSLSHILEFRKLTNLEHTKLMIREHALSTLKEATYLLWPKAS